MKNNLQKVINSKKTYRKKEQKLPINKKIEKLISLQKLTFEILKSTGRSLPRGKRVWKI